MKIEQLEELLIPLFDSVHQYNYDPNTAIARLSPEEVPGHSYNECIEYIRDLLVTILPNAVIVDAGGVYRTSTERKSSYGWWIQFKL